MKERIIFIELNVFLFGTITREAIMTAFEVGPACATRSIAKYIEMAPTNMNYCSNKKTYLKSNSFKPYFKFSSSKLIGILAKVSGVISKDDILVI